MREKGADPMAHIDLVPPGKRLPLRYFLSHYPTMNQENPEPITNALSLLYPRVDTRPFHVDHSGATLMCTVLPMIAKTVRKRLRQGKRALGGRAHPQRFSRQDFAIKPLDEAKLPKELGPLCRMLKNELPRLVRLVLEAEAAYEADLERYWHACHEALAIALLREQTIWEALRRQTSPWFALLCLRWALRCCWETFLGEETFTREARTWLEEIPITICQERELMRLLFRVGEGRVSAPEPFAALIARWRAGDLPPAPPPNVRLRDWPEGQKSRCMV